MATDNPYHAPSAVDLPGGANEAGSLEPVPIEPVAVLLRSWELLLRHPGPVLGAVLLAAVPQLAASIGSAVLDLLTESARSDEQQLLLSLAGLGVQGVSSFVGIYLSLGQARIFSRVARGLDAEVLMLFGEARHLPGALVASIALALAVGVGFCLLIVPGVIVALGLSMTFFAMVDQDLGPIEAMQESWRLTEGSLVQILLVGLSLAVVGMLFGCATLCMGFLLVTPLLTLSQAVMYHSLLSTRGPRPT